MIKIKILTPDYFYYKMSSGVIRIVIYSLLFDIRGALA